RITVCSRKIWGAYQETALVPADDRAACSSCSDASRAPKPGGAPIFNHAFANEFDQSVVLLPAALKDIVGGWGKIRQAMARRVPENFTRDEWGYLMSFLSEENL